MAKVKYSIDKQIEAVIEARDIIVRMIKYTPCTCPNAGSMLERLGTKVDVLDDAITTLKKYKEVASG